MSKKTSGTDETRGLFAETKRHDICSSAFVFNVQFMEIEMSEQKKPSKVRVHLKPKAPSALTLSVAGAATGTKPVAPQT
jgi:hypothetical protein